MNKVMIAVLIIVVFVSCEYKQRKSVEQLDDMNLMDKAIALHERSEYEHSNKILLKMYSAEPDHSSGVCFYLFLNYAMLNDCEEAKRFFNKTIEQTIVYYELKKALENEKYKKLLSDNCVSQEIQRIIAAGAPE